MPTKSFNPITKSRRYITVLDYAELTRTAAALKANNLKDVPARAEVMAAELKELNKQLEAAKAELAANEVNRLFVFKDRRKVNMDDVASIDSPLFEGYDF